jgi:hypothetical protein
LRLVTSRCIREQPVASPAGPGQRRPGRTAAARDALGLRIIGHVTRLTWHQLLSLHLMHLRALEPDVPAAASSPSAPRHTDVPSAPQTWPARTAVADRRTLLTWACTTGGQTLPVIANPGNSPKVPVPAGVFSVVGILLSTSFIDGQREGADVSALLPVLSTYLGHVEPANTYWYYSDSRVIPIPAPLPA